MKHRLSSQDLGKRNKNRRFSALQALLKAGKEAVTPLDLAKAWSVHPSSAYRVLERLRKFKTVDRDGLGLEARYWITEKGVGRLEWFSKTQGKRK